MAVWGARFPHHNHTITPDMKRALPAPVRSGSGLEGIAPLYNCRASGLRGPLRPHSSDSVEAVSGKRPCPPTRWRGAPFRKQRLAQASADLPKL